MKEPTRNEIAEAVIALLNLQSHQNWMITPQLRQTIKDCIEDLRFYYQFAYNDKKGEHISPLNDCLEH